jgi:hypothetical protein
MIIDARRKASSLFVGKDVFDLKQIACLPAQPSSLPVIFSLLFSPNGESAID